VSLLCRRSRLVVVAGSRLPKNWSGLKCVFILQLPAPVQIRSPSMTERFSPQHAQVDSP
jgi:hypothetical protein